jgi:hypothetical protein
MPREAVQNPYSEGMGYERKPDKVKKQPDAKPMPKVATAGTGDPKIIVPKKKKP